jgi:hypothetical protein
MNLWYKLVSFSIDPTAPTAGIASTLKDLYAKMKAVNVQMHGDAMLGFILQSAIMALSAGFKHDFEQQVELAIQRDPQSACPTFSLLVHLFDICRQQHQLAADHQSDHPLPSNSPSVFLASPTPAEDFDVSAFLADINKPEWPDCP